jgi:hypothetical protein
MNQYQRMGTFVVRLIGVVVGLLGVFGEVYAATVAAGIMVASPGRPPSVLGSVFWLAGGVALVSASRPLGRWLGRGLD